MVGLGRVGRREGGGGKRGALIVNERTDKQEERNHTKRERDRERTRESTKGDR